MKCLLAGLGALLLCQAVHAQNANYCDANCEKVKAGILQNEQKMRSNERRDGPREPPSSQPREPQVPRPMSAEDRQALQRSRASSDAWFAEQHRIAGAAIAEGYKWRYGQGVPVDVDKAMQAFRSACDTLAISHGCGLAAELGFEALEDQRPPDYRGPASATLRAQAPALLELAQRGCRANVRHACFVNRRIRTALNELDLGPWLSDADAAEFARYDDERRRRRARNLQAAPAPAGAPVAALVAAPVQWSYLGTSPVGTAFYIDKNSIVRDGTSVKVWQLMDLPQPVRLGNGTMAKSGKTQWELDCAAKQVRRVQAQAFAEVAGDGAMLGSERYQEPWSRIEPNTHVEALRQAGC